MKVVVVHESKGTSSKAMTKKRCNLIRKKFPLQRLRWEKSELTICTYTRKTYEPPRGKTNNVVSEQVRHKPTCTSTEKS